MSGAAANAESFSRRHDGYPGGVTVAFFVHRRWSLRDRRRLADVEVAQRRQAGRWWGLAGAVVLILYGIIPTLQASHFGRIYAVYGGFFIVLSLLWGWYFDGNRPDWPDVVGGAIALLGVSVMMYWPRIVTPPAGGVP